ncbi:MAG TPA: hypothetical protein VGQ09_14855 [Chitinophagaceae bacterium]|nr:hypothetical protein [Chitinophagaceae bacterium]
MTEDYVYNSNGFSEGFAIQLLKVSKFNNDKSPEIYEEDSIRVDLNYSNKGKIQKKLWFYKVNEGYYWTYGLRDSFGTLPIQFKRGQWYVLWSNTFKSGFFKTNHYKFFIHVNNSGKLEIQKSMMQTNL